MSRIHEAIQRAAGERKLGQSRDLQAARDILSATSAIGNGRIPEDATENPACEVSSSEPEKPPLGAEAEWKPLAENILFFSEEGSAPCKEEFRILRTRIYERAKIQRLSVIGVGSALAGEGKSFVSANLASVLAMHRERRVLLVDCDLRRGVLSTLFGAREAPGLTEYLQEKQPLSRILQSDPRLNLSLISHGEDHQAGGDLLSTSRFKELIRQLRSAFDWIVIDTPPAIHFSDANIIAQECDGMLLVVGAGKAPARFARQVATEFAKRRLLGVVLNRAEQVAALARNYSDYEHYKVKSLNAASGKALS